MYFIIISLAVLAIIFLLISFAYFISPKLSPIPFFPTNQKDLPKIVEVLLKGSEDTRFERLEGNQTGKLTSRSEKRGIELPINLSTESASIIDLGAGTGTVLFAAARVAFQKNLPIQFFAVEIHPLLILIMHLRRLFHPNRKNIQILRADIFQFDYESLKSNNLTIYLYVGPFVMEKLKKKLILLPQKTSIVSYMYEIPGWSTKLTRKIIAYRPIYVYSL